MCRVPVLIGLSLLITACTTPVQKLEQRASQFGFSAALIDGQPFAHRVFFKAGHSGHKQRLHVYLDGDGTPWLKRYLIAAEPTPREHLVLRLMARDESPSLYLGRPCYHGQAQIPPCNPLMWTNRRYSPEVVASMAAALTHWLQQLAHHDTELVFVGFSGGGVLAMLLAERFVQTRAVITVAANLDISAWAAWHGYSPLTGSLNPAQRPPLPATIIQFHYAGGQDTKVPPQLIQTALHRQKCATFDVIKTYDHKCCWERDWHLRLTRLENSLTAQVGCNAERATFSSGIWH